jgi:hypothetical protein
MQMKIKLILSCLVIVGIVLGIGNLADVASAHGDKPHPKCKRGYQVDDQHKCVRRK